MNNNRDMNKNNINNRKGKQGNLDSVLIERLAGYLDLEEEKIRHLFEKKYLQRNWGRHEDLFRFDKEIANIENGSVVYERNGSFEMIVGFPKIRRAMALEPALKKQFKMIKKVALEEKMNGYNVRVAEVNGEILAITRSGFICPYTTERARKMLNLRFFDEHPELVLYGEMVGPDNPYVPKDIYDIESVDFFIFDVREKSTGKPLSVARRRELLEHYGFRQVRLFGEFPLEKAAEEIKKIILELGKIKHEGVVIKDPAMVFPPIKYTSSQSNCSDLHHAFKFYYETGRDFMLSRIVREGFQAVEWNESEEDFKKRCLQLGESILTPLRDSVYTVKTGKRLYEEVQIRVKALETAAEFEEYLKRVGVETVFSPPEAVGDEYLIKIKKMNKSTTDKTQTVWEGEVW